MSKIEVVKFDETFNQIPEQDNPAFGKTECILVCRTDHPTNRYSILHIIPDPTESVNGVAVVVDEAMADFFAAALATSLEKP